MLTTSSFIPKNTQGAVILCHGYGSDGDDLMGLVPYLKEHLPDTAFFAPNAPIELGFGYEWFQLEDYQPNQPISAEFLAELTKRAEKPAEKLRTLINHIQDKYHLTAQDITLLGFSQGGLMATYTALTNPEPLGHVIALSAIPIVWTDKLASRFTPKQMPFFIAHGSIDPIVPVAAVDFNLTQLRKAGQNPSTFISQGIEHAIDQPILDHTINFILENK